MACVSGGTYFAISSLRSARISRRGRMSVSGLDSSRERHFISRARRTDRDPSTTLPFASLATTSLRMTSGYRYAGNCNRPLTTDLLHPRHLHPRQSPREARLPHLLEHLFHLRVLAKKIVYFLHGRPRSAGDTLAAVAVDHFMMIALVRRHRIDDGLDAVDLLLVDIIGGFLQAGEWTDRGQHAHDALHRSHFFDLAQLVTKIFQREAVAGQGLGGHFLRLLLVDLRFRALDQREDIAHAQNARHNAVGMKRLQRIIFFADADELDGLSC